MVWEKSDLPDEMRPEYWDTHFRVCEPAISWPTAFAIVTAYATTGQKWTDEQNEAADVTLQRELRKLGSWVLRMTGYSPKTQHAEPGWAVDLPFNDACDLGLRFQQDAIYYVDQDLLSVSHCDCRRQRIPIGPFRVRVHLAD
jgi:hypothetical protein